MIVTNLTLHPLFLGKRAILPIGTSEISRGVERDCDHLIMHWVSRGFLRVEKAEEKPVEKKPAAPVAKKAPTKKKTTKRSTKKKTTKKRSTSTEG